MTARVLLGWLLLAAPFVGFGCFMYSQAGWGAVVFVYGTTLALVLLVAAAVWLINGSLS